MNEHDKIIRTMYGGEKFEDPRFAHLIEAYETSIITTQNILEGIKKVRYQEKIIDECMGEWDENCDKVIDSLHLKGWRMSADSSQIELIIPDIPSSIYIRKGSSAVTAQKNQWIENITVMLNSL